MKYALVLDEYETNEWFRLRNIINEKKHAEAVKISLAKEMPVDIISYDGEVLESLLAQKILCPTCEGSGSCSRYGKVKCHDCGGSGEKTKEELDYDFH